jgi:hypothetical protein
MSPGQKYCTIEGIGCHLGRRQTVYTVWKHWDTQQDDSSLCLSFLNIDKKKSSVWLLSSCKSPASFRLHTKEKFDQKMCEWMGAVQEGEKERSKGFNCASCHTHTHTRTLTHSHTVCFVLCCSWARGLQSERELARLPLRILFHPQRTTW